MIACWVFWGFGGRLIAGALMGTYTGGGELMSEMFGGGGNDVGPPQLMQAEVWW